MFSRLLKHLFRGFRLFCAFDALLASLTLKKVSKWVWLGLAVVVGVCGWGCLARVWFGIVVWFVLVWVHPCIKGKSTEYFPPRVFFD